eukprot:scaffold8.g1621.t1
MDQDQDLYSDVYVTAPTGQLQPPQHFFQTGSAVATQPTGDAAALQQLLAEARTELQRSQAAEAQLKEEVAALRQREAALQAEACSRSAENLQLRRELSAARQAAEPSVVQLRQLLLDPAVNREVSRLRTELEARMRELAVLKEELATVAFSGSDGKGRMLVAKCRALQQEENDELNRQLGEGRIAALERALAASREQLAELKATYAELEDHAHALDDESELLQQQLLLGRRYAPTGACGLSLLARPC